MPADWITTSAPYLEPRAVGAPDPWQAETAAAGHAGGSKLTKVAVAAPPAAVAALLGITPRDSAVLRRRLVTLDGPVVEIADSWYPLAVAEGTGLAEMKPIRGGAVRLLATLGYSAARHIEDIAVVDTPAHLVDVLGTGPLLELTRTSYTVAGLPFEVARMLMSRELTPGVLRRLRYELRST